MHFTSIVLAAASLAAQAGAIDIRGWSGGKCDNRAYFVWTNAQPNVCHETRSNAIYIRSFSLDAVPTAWGHIRFAKYRYGNYQCSNPHDNFIISLNGRTSVCSGQNANVYQPMGGAKYWFASKKARSTSDSETLEGAECVYPDTMVGDDGQQYDIKDLDDDALVKLWESTDEVRHAEFAHIKK